jgi:hypothetical protein
LRKVNVTGHISQLAARWEFCCGAPKRMTKQDI